MRKMFTLLSAPKRYLSYMGLALTMVWGTTATAQYCPPQSTFDCSVGDDIGNFATTGGTTMNISNLGSGCSAGGYSLTPASTMTVDVAPNATFNFTVNTGGNFSQGFRVWVDWNNDQDFTDPGEDMWNSGTWGTGVFNGSVTVPATATGGIYRMRLRCSWNSLPTDPCANQTYGEVEDYEITVMPPLANDAGVSAMITPPAIACTLDTMVEVEITNYGTDTLTSANVNWTFNGTLQTAASWTGSLAQGQTANVTVATNLTYNVGDNFEFWTSMPNMVTDSNALNDTALGTVLPLSLNGTYTIDGASATGGTNFNNFTDAVNALNSVGVCGPVIIDVANGNYNEQLIFTEIPGADSVNTITFRGDSMSNQNVTLEYGATLSGANYTIQLDGGDWIGFEDMTISGTGGTYTRVLDFTNGANNNWINNCLIQGDLNTTTTSFNKALIYSNGTLDENNSFLNSEFRGGSYSMYWRGIGTTNTENGTVVENCLFSRWYYMGMYAWYHNDMKLRNNVFSTLSSYAFTSYGMYIWYSDGAQEVTGNRIEPINNVPRRSMYFVNCDATNANRGLIANNSFVCGDSTTNNSFWGFYMSNSGYQQVVHNTFVTHGTSAVTYTVYIPSGGGNVLKNNNIITWGNGIGLFLGNSFAVVDADNNNHYAPNGNVASFNGLQATLADWQNVSGFDANSYSVDPHFYNWQANDLHVCNDTLDNTGADLSGLVVADYDGQGRNTTTPDIGADEFSSLGAYTIGLDTSVICMGDSLMLMGADGAQNIWSTGDTALSITVSMAGSYSVNVTNACGTIGDTTEAIMNTPVDLPANQNLCAGDSATLMSNIMGTYDWNNGLATSQSLLVTGPGTYKVEVTDPFGCESADSTIVTQSVDTDIIGDTLICTGDDVTLDAGIPGSSYIWSDGSSSQTLTITTSGTYGVTVTDQFNCVSSDQMTLTTQDQPVASFSGTVSFLTLNATNTSTNASSYTWIWGDGTTSNLFEPNHVYPEADSFTVMLVATNFCGSDTATLVIETSATGVGELFAYNAISVYPNPNQGQFTLSIDAQEAREFDLQVVDLQGRVVVSRNLGELYGKTNHEIRLDQVSAGVYFVKLNAGSDLAILRVTVK